MKLGEAVDDDDDDDDDDDEGLVRKIFTIFLVVRLRGTSHN